MAAPRARGASKAAVATSSPGPGVDASGTPVIDPTANVIAILQAAVERQDDLREAEMTHVKEMAALRASYDHELREAEAKRIDAIRAVDVNNVSRAAEVAATQAQTLQAQVAGSAEALRLQVATTAAAAATNLANALEPIQKDIAELRKAQYEQQGQKTQVAESRLAADDLSPILKALAQQSAAIQGLQTLQEQRVGAAGQVNATRDNTRFYIALLGALVTAVGLFEVVRAAAGK